MFTSFHSLILEPGFCDSGQVSQDESFVFVFFFTNKGQAEDMVFVEGAGSVVGRPHILDQVPTPPHPDALYINSPC